MNKSELFAAVRQHLEARRADLLRTQGDARSGARVDGDHRPENRGERAAVTSQGYLTAGIGQLVAELDAALVWLDRVDPGPRDRVTVGAWVTLVDDDDAERSLILLPGGQGATVQGVVVLSPDAPLAKALEGKEVDDSVPFRGVDWVIASIA